MSEQRQPRELTGDERRELTRRMDVVYAVMWGTANLLSRRDLLVEQVKEYGGRFRSKWGIGLVILAAIVAWLGDSADWPWLHSAGTTSLVLLAFWFLPVLPDWYIAERKLERIDAQLWEMRYRWRANGGNDAQFDDLKALHQPDVGIELDTDEYGHWWHAVRAEMQEKAMPLACREAIE
ncbi:MAG: hypothetical protein LT102_15885 [Burkholderiaceae bacterium]|nr:hypothetical protein [Burkholderiaceae bacterium]